MNERQKKIMVPYQEPTDTCQDCSNHPCDCGLPAGYTPIPRTNARWERLCCSGQSWYKIAEEMKLDCRQLERELTATREELLKTIEERRQEAIKAAAAKSGLLMWQNCAEDAERELAAITEQLKAARRLAEKYRNLSCESQEEADVTLLPWEGGADES